jgi:KipI family sensor histidine kinase inhibitor
VTVRNLEGFYVQFSDQLNQSANAKLHALSNRLLQEIQAQRAPQGLTDLYPGYVNLFVEFDAQQTTRETVKAWVRSKLEHPESEQTTAQQADLEPREVQVRVRYDGEDLEWIATQTGLSVTEVIATHSGQAYRVFAVGFVPGYPFLGVLPEALRLPRRPTPRKRVPAHTVAMAVSQTGIYVLPTPGGWHLLGTALEAIYDPTRDKPFLLEPGDQVRFVPSDGPTPAEPSVLELLPSVPQRPVLRVERPGLLDLMVDQGRFMGGRYGMARSGPMDAKSARLANAMLGNPNDAALLELTLTGPTLSVLEDAMIGLAGYGMQAFVNDRAVPTLESCAVRRGDHISFKPGPHGTRMYLAINGGFESRSFMGSRSTDLTGRIGRALKSADLLGRNPSTDPETGPSSKPRAGYSVKNFASPQATQTVIRLQPGPQATHEALTAFTSGEFTVTSPDRMGVQLEGPKIPGGELISEATPMGGVQVTTNGNPILLLNDRGRIGGYAKPAVIDPRDLPLVAQLRPGQTVRFQVDFSGDLHEWQERWTLDATDSNDGKLHKQTSSS